MILVKTSETLLKIDKVDILKILITNYISFNDNLKY